MTTGRSPPAVLKAQADQIAGVLKRAERGEPVSAPFAQKVAEARARGEIKFAIVMDDKLITLEVPWPMIGETSEAALSAWIVEQMRGTAPQ